MIAIAAALLARLGLSQGLAGKVAPWAVGLLIAIVALLAVAAWDHFDDEAAIRADRLEGDVEQLEDQVAADAGAADRRLRDAAAIREQEEAFAKAIDDPRPGDAGDPGVRRACEQLRRDGQDTRGLAACGGR